MAGEVARLGLEVTSGPVKDASADLTAFTASAQKAEAAAAGLAGGTQRAASAATQMTAATKAEAAALQVQAAGARASAQALKAQEAAARGARMQSRQLMFQLVDVGQALATAPTMGIYALQNLGFQFAQIGQMYAGNGGLKAALSDSAGQIGRFAAKLGPLAVAVAALGVGFEALKSRINETGKQAVSLGNVFNATIDLAVEGFQSRLKPAIDVMKGWWHAAWSAVGDWAVQEFNTIAQNAVQFVEQIKFAATSIQIAWTTSVSVISTAWGALPKVLGDIVYSTADKVIGGIEGMVQKAIDGLNNLMNKYALWRANIGQPLDPATFNKMIIGPVSFGRLGNPDAGATEDYKAKIKGIIADGANQIKDAYDVMQKAVADARGHDFFGDMATKARELAKASADAAKKVKDAADAASKFPKVSRDAMAQARALNRDAQQAARFWSGTARGFVDDFTQGLDQGKSAWKAFADAAVNALKRIADKLLDQAFDGLFGVRGGGGGGIFSFLGGGFGGGGGLSSTALAAVAGGAGGLYAKGGIFEHGISAYSNSIVDRPTRFRFAHGAGLMGEAGPEGILPLRRNSQGQLGVIAGGGGNNNQPPAYNDNRQYHIDARGAQKGVGEEIRRALEDYDRNVAPHTAKAAVNASYNAGRNIGRL